MFGSRKTGPSNSRHLSCTRCRWADPVVGSDDETFVECKRFPPVPVGVGETLMVVWPQVTAGDYCGEWEEK